MTRSIPSLFKRSSERIIRDFPSISNNPFGHSPITFCKRTPIPAASMTAVLILANGDLFIVIQDTSRLLDFSETLPFG